MEQSWRDKAELMLSEKSKNMKLSLLILVKNTTNIGGIFRDMRGKKARIWIVLR